MPAERRARAFGVAPVERPWRRDIREIADAER